MTMPGDPDATMPVQPTPRTGGMDADATQPVTRAEYPGGPGGPGGGQPPYDEDDDGANRRRLWMIAAAVLVLGVLVGVLVAVLASGGDDDTPTTTTSSSTTSSSTTTTAPPTTTTAAPAAPAILQFAGNPSPYPCPGSGQIQLTWSTQNTSGVSISIDNSGVYGNYGPTGNAQVPFACGGPSQHTYVLTANGNNGQKPQQTIVVQAQNPPTTSTTEP